jgi:hypothetical protein
LAPNTTYFYICGDSSLDALSEENQFTTFPQPDAATSDNNYPSRIAVVADLGLTYNSSTTFDHIQSNNPSLLLLVGDLSYANNYITTGVRGARCYSCAFPNTPIHETYQPHWDAWGRYFDFQTYNFFILLKMFNELLKHEVRMLLFFVANSHLTLI